MANHLTTRTAPLRAVALAPQLPEPLLPWVNPPGAESEWNDTLVARWYRPRSIPAEVKAMLPAVIEAHTAALTPVRSDFLAAHLAKEASVFPDAKRSSEDWKIFVETAMGDLGNFPADIILAALKEHRLKSRWYPTIAELNEICLRLDKERRFRILRMESLLKIPTPEEVEAKQQAEDDLRAAELEARLKASPDLRLAQKWEVIHSSKTSVVNWLQFLAAYVPKYGFDVVDAWHTEVMADVIPLPGFADVMPGLRKAARRHDLLHDPDYEMPRRASAVFGIPLGAAVALVADKAIRSALGSAPTDEAIREAVPADALERVMANPVLMEKTEDDETLSREAA